MENTVFTRGDASYVLERLAKEPLVWVAVARTEGSAPREVGAWMAVFAQGEVGTIGGGHLEWAAIRHARALLVSGQARADTQRYPLGPSLGQCCGGVVHLSFEPLAAGALAVVRQRLNPPGPPVALFGGGHVGHAIAQALAPLPLALHWVDSREGVFPQGLPPHVSTEHSEPVQAAVRDLPAGTRVLVMSFSHAEDLETVAACLDRRRRADDLPFVGLIGSATKWAVFQRRLAARGYTEAELAGVTCPIGLPGIRGKQPAVIAASVVAQLLLLPS
jgi:xanthine dehydrogenase accessory factor